MFKTNGSGDLLGIDQKVTRRVFIIMYYVVK